MIPKRRPQDFSRCRKLPLARLIVVLLSLVASGRDKGVETKLGEFFTLARRSDLWPEGQSPHRSALTKARAKIPWQAFETLLNHTVALAYEVFPPQRISVAGLSSSPRWPNTLPPLRSAAAFRPQSAWSILAGHYPQVWSDGVHVSAACVCRTSVHPGGL